MVNIHGANTCRALSMRGIIHDRGERLGCIYTSYEVLYIDYIKCQHAYIIYKQLRLWSVYISLLHRTQIAWLWDKQGLWGIRIEREVQKQWFWTPRRPSCKRGGSVGAALLRNIYTGRNFVRRGSMATCPVSSFSPKMHPFFPPCPEIPRKHPCHKNAKIRHVGKTRFFSVFSPFLPRNRWYINVFTRFICFIPLTHTYPPLCMYIPFTLITYMLYML